MAFIGSIKEGKTHNAGWFLAHEECTRETYEIPQSLATTAENGTKYVPMGTVLSVTTGEGAGAVTTYFGIIYEDVDVTVGNMPGSVVTRGEVYEDRLPDTLESDAKTALEAIGIKFVADSAVTRPNWTNS